jgi:uncharacterized protein (DUF433 family)
MIFDLIEVNPEKQSGKPVFKGTRVPVETLFFHLEKGMPIDEFLTDFPSVTREQVVAIISYAEKLFQPQNIYRLNEFAA